MILCACADPGHHQTDSFVGTFLFWGTSPWTSIAADFDLPLEKKGFSGKKRFQRVLFSNAWLAANRTER
jgi:hypothetical protein